MLVKSFGVGCVIQSDGGPHTLSAQTGASECRRLLQNHEAVAMETTLEPVRGCHVAQDLREPWSEAQRGRSLSGTFTDVSVFYTRFFFGGTLTWLQKLPALPH